jgi:hypothetical protein
MGKKGKSKTRKKARIRDLTPKNTKQVKGGAVNIQDIHFTTTSNKSSASL